MELNPVNQNVSPEVREYAKNFGERKAALTTSDTRTLQKKT